MYPRRRATHLSLLFSWRHRTRRGRLRGNSRSSPTGCAALCTAVCRVSAKVVCFGRPSACTNVLRNHSEPFLWRFLQAAGLPPFGTKRWCQKHPPGETAGNRRSFFFPRFRKAEFVVRYRATVIIDFPHMATRELAVLPILRDEACGARIAGLRGRRLRPARRPMAP